MGSNDDQTEFRYPAARLEGSPEPLAWSEMLPGVRFSVVRTWRAFDDSERPSDNSLEILDAGTVTGEPFVYMSPTEPNQGRFADGTLVVSVRWNTGEEGLVSANARFGFAPVRYEEPGPILGDCYCIATE